MEIYMKRNTLRTLLSVSLSAAMVMSATPLSAFAVTGGYPLGDLDFNGELNASDLTALARAVGGVEELTKEGYTLYDGIAYELGDVDVDGGLAASDLTALARAVGGVETLPAAGQAVTYKGTYNEKTFAAEEYGLGNTDLLGIEIKDQNGDGVIHIGCIGDSITAGNPGKCYPDYLQEYLNELSKTDGNTYVVHNNGKGGAGVGNDEEQVGDPNWGWSTVIDEDGDGKAYFYYDDIAYRSAFDYVHDVTIIQMGTNNWADGNLQNHFKEDYYNWLIKPFQDMGSQIVISTAPYAYESLYKDAINRTVHDEIVELAWEQNLPLVDMNRLTYGMDEIYDGIHPFPAGYSVMALLFYEHIFGGQPSVVSVEAQAGSKVTFIDGQGRSFNRNVPESGKVEMLLSPAETTYNVSVECEGYLTYRETLTVSGSMSFKPEQIAATNVALDGTTFACDSPVYQGSVPHDHNLINDGDLTATGYQPNAYKNGDYVGVEFDKANVSIINIYWETAAYISSFDKNGFDVEFKVNGEWVKQTASELTVARNTYTGDIVCDVITVNTPAEIEGVKITFRDGDITDHKFAPKLYELEVFAE